MTAGLRGCHHQAGQRDMSPWAAARGLSGGDSARQSQGNVPVSKDTFGTGLSLGDGFHQLSGVTQEQSRVWLLLAVWLALVAGVALLVWLWTTGLVNPGHSGGTANGQPGTGIYAGRWLPVHSTPSGQSVRTVHPDIFVDRATLYWAVGRSTVLAGNSGGKGERQGQLPGQGASPWGIRGGVVPHHLLAGDLIAGFFARVSGQDIKRVILVGPNHPGQGARVMVSSAGWATAGGVVEPDLEVVRALARAGLAVEDDGMMAGEHSIGTIMPFIKHYLGQARVVPVILQSNITLKEAGALAAFLEPYLTPDTLLVASVDFSHYLTRAEAEARDARILQVMEGWDLGTLFTMGNDYLDSPPSLGVLFRAMEALGIRQFTVLANTNSGRIAQNDHMETTSYFVLAF